MNKLELAKTLAICYHDGQKDRGGKEYINHPFWVYKHCSGRSAKIVALLHDIIEDTECTFEILKNLGFSKRIIKALTAITHTKSMSYENYISICMTDKIARQVKFWDMIHNSDLTRIEDITQKDIDNAYKYIRCAITLANNNAKLINIVKIADTNLHILLGAENGEKINEVTA